MAEEWAYEEASDEEKLQIAQRFLLASPPGQVHEVLRDVAKLVPAHVLPDAALKGRAARVQRQNCLPVDVPDADYKARSPLICSRHQEIEVLTTVLFDTVDLDLRGGEVDAAHYIDPIGNRILGFDHIKQQVVADDVAEIPEERISDFEKER